MTSIREEAEKHWRGEGELVFAHHPVQRFERGAGEEIADGVYVLKSVASVNAVDTGDGLVLLDTGGPYDVDLVYERIRAWRPDTRLKAAVYSHHHIDHCFGTKRFEAEATERGWAQPVVYAHEALPDHFHRYRHTHGWNTAINQRQFAQPVDSYRWPEEYRFPDVTYAKATTFTSGTDTFELRHALGETDDATWTWIPERKLLHPGDLFIWALPNAGNPQKVQRYVGDWADALREMAALGADTMACGHGLPIFGADRIREALCDTAELLEHLERESVAIMNTGANLERVIREVEVPAHLAAKPYLRAVYDHPQFVVRNVWRRYGGWWSGEPDQLLPAPLVDQAREWVRLAGGVDVVLARAVELSEAGDHAMACHLVEHVVRADPHAAGVHEARARIYEAYAAPQESLMARHLLRHAAQSSQRGLRDLAGGW